MCAHLTKLYICIVFELKIVYFSSVNLLSLHKILYMKKEVKKVEKIT